MSLNKFFMSWSGRLRFVSRSCSLVGQFKRSSRSLQLLKTDLSRHRTTTRSTDRVRMEARQKNLKIHNGKNYT
jgi:hypothetical protein